MILFCQRFPGAILPAGWYRNIDESHETMLGKYQTRARVKLFLKVPLHKGQRNTMLLHPGSCTK